MTYRIGNVFRAAISATAFLSFPVSNADGATPARPVSRTAPVVFEPGPGPRPRFQARASAYRMLLDESGIAIARRQSGTEVRFRFSNSRPVTPAAERPLPGVSNYFLGRDSSRWRTRVPHFSAVRYRDLYPGVDAVFYGAQGHVEFDLELRPGAAPQSITVVYDGAKKLHIDPNGDLRIFADGEHLIQRKPRAFQQTVNGRSEVEVRYSLQGRTVSLITGKYDRSRALVIDPVLEWGTFIGGTGEDIASHIATDSVGNVYLTGTTQSADFPVTRSVQAQYRGARDVFITKLNATGTAILYSTYLGGSGDDTGASITVDASNNAWVTGSATSRDFPTRNASQPALAGAEDAVVVKLNDSGTDLLMSTYLGGSGSDSGQSVAVNPSGAVVVGETSSTDLSGVTEVSLQQKNAGGKDAFVARFNPQGARQGVTYYGGTRDDAAYAVATSFNGDLYLTGESMSPRLPGQDDSRFQYFNRASGFSAFVLRVDSTARQVVYATFLGGSVDQAGFAIAVDISGAACVAGVTTSSDFPVTNNALQRSYRGSSDGFVTVLDPSGNTLLGSTYVGGSANDYITSIQLDSAGRIYVGGYTESLDILTSLRPPSTRGRTFIAQITSAADQARFGTYLDATSNTFTVALAVRLQSGGDDVYAAGSASSNFRFPSMRGRQLRPYAGGNDAFVVRLANADVRIRNREQLLNAAPVRSATGNRDASAAPGGNSEVLFEVTNTGPADAESVEVVVPMPQGITAVRCASVLGRCTIASDTVRVFYDSLRVGAVDNITITVRSSLGTPQGSDFSVLANVSSATNDPESDNNQAGANVSIIGVVPFTVVPVGTAVFGNVAIGDTGTVDVVVRPNNAVNVDLRFTSTTGAANPAFALAQAVTFPVSINQERRFPIAFRPTGSGQSVGQLDIRAVDLGYVYTLDLTANGTTPLNLPSVTEVVDGAGFRPTISANGWVTIKGANLARTTRPWRGSDFTASSLPRELEGTSVMINGRPAYVSYISPTQVNVLAPVGDTTTGNVSVRVTAPTGTVTATANKQALSAGFFLIDATQVAAVFPNGSLVARPGTFPPPLDSTRGARPGEEISMYLGGLGTTTPVAPEGVIPTSASNLVSTATAQIGGATATITFAGMSVLPGLYQINIVVPASLGAGDHAVTLTVAGQSTQPGVTLRVQP